MLFCLESVCKDTNIFKTDKIFLHHGQEKTQADTIPNQRNLLPANADIQESENQIRLENFEDSIYHSRRPNRTFLRNTIQNQHHKSIKTDSLYTSEPPAPVRKPLMVELNSADSTTLQLLHGTAVLIAAEHPGQGENEQ